MQVPGQGIVPRGRPTTDFKEYPKMMRHPQERAGKPSPEIKSPHGFTYHGIGEPVRFPPVLVRSKEQEEYHLSLGYENPVKCSMEAFDRAVGAGQLPDQVAYKPLEYPKWVQGKLCNTHEEEEAWLVKCGAVPTVQVVALSTAADIVAATVAEVRELEDRPDIAATGLENLTQRRARLLRELAEIDEEAVDVANSILDQAKGPSKPKKATAPKKTRKPIVRTAQQKRDHSEAIKAGMARKRAKDLELTESKST